MKSERRPHIARTARQFVIARPGLRGGGDCQRIDPCRFRFRDRGLEVGIEIEVAVEIDTAGGDIITHPGCDLTPPQYAHFLKATPINACERCLASRRLIEEWAGFVDQDGRQGRPGAKSLDRELEGTDLHTLGLARVEGAGCQIIDRVDGRVGAGTKSCDKRRASDQARQAISAVLRAETLPASLGGSRTGQR